MRDTELQEFVDKIVDAKGKTTEIAHIVMNVYRLGYSEGSAEGAEELLSI